MSIPAPGVAYRRVVAPDLKVPVQILRPDGLPHLPLTVFANKAGAYLAAGSVRQYTYVLMKFAAFADSNSAVQRQGWELDGPPDGVRRTIRLYLSTKLRCILRPVRTATPMLGYYVRPQPNCDKGVRSFLASLKVYYHVLIEEGWYSYAHPLISEMAVDENRVIRKRRADMFRSRNGRAPMPKISGVDEPQVEQRQTDSYFRLVEEVWQPHIIDDHNLPMIVRKAGEAAGWSLRECAIASVLFDSGARIGEVLVLSLQDWMLSGFGTLLHAPSKGSRGVRTKRLQISNSTAKLLHRYLDTARREFDPHGLSLGQYRKSIERGEVDAASIPLFPSRRGTPLTPSTFRCLYWNPAMRNSGLKVRPHQARHWFVTTCMRELRNACTDHQERERMEERLVEYMKWRSGHSMLRVYNHHLGDVDVTEFIGRMHKKFEEIERDQGGVPPVKIRDIDQLYDACDEDLQTIFGAKEQKDG